MLVFASSRARFRVCPPLAALPFAAADAISTASSCCERVGFLLAPDAETCSCASSSTSYSNIPANFEI